MERRGLATAVGLMALLAGAATASEPEPTDEPVRVWWDSGRTRLRGRQVGLELTNRLQVLWSALWLDEPDGTSPERLRIRRAKTKLSGWAYSERVGFALQVNWARAAGILEDAYLDLDATGGGALRLRLGQYKVPFGRQELTSSASHQFLSRSITSRQFARGRDVGVMLHGQLGDRWLRWAVGAFNGSGTGRLANPDGRYQVDARIQVAPAGDPGDFEADLDRSPRPLYAFGVQYEHNDHGLGTERRRHSTWGADAVLKYRGLFLFGEAFRSVLEPDGAPSLTRNGFALQGGYLLRRVELAGRFARLDRGAGEVLRESGLALSWYVEGQRLRLQCDFRWLDGDRPGQEGTALRAQAQIVF